MRSDMRERFANWLMFVAARMGAQVYPVVAANEQGMNHCVRIFADYRLAERAHRKQHHRHGARASVSGRFIQT